MSNWNNQNQTAMIAGQLYKFRSKFEYRYARYLEWLRKMGQIKSWTYESKNFIFKNVETSPVSYLPDFIVTGMDGVVDIHEVKGYLTGKDNSKFRRMADQYPEYKIVLVMMVPDKKRAGTYRIAKKYIKYHEIKYMRKTFRDLGF